MALSELFEDTPRVKLVLLKKYRNELKDLNDMAYRVLSMAADMKRPHEEIKKLTALVEGFSEGSWWSLKSELAELTKQGAKD